MLVKVSELEGRALNYAVAVCLWGKPAKTKSFYNWIAPEIYVCADNNPWPEDEEGEFNPCGDWAHGGPLISKQEVYLFSDFDGYIAAIHAVFDDHHDIDVRESGSNALEAVCRCIVKYRNRCDEEIEIPDELMEA